MVRIDTVPKVGLGDATATALLAAATGVLELTRSAGKASTVVNLVKVADDDFRWGVVDGSDARALGLMLNHNAAREVGSCTS
jgi:hypothetical protein